MAKSYTSTINLRTWKEHTCAGCGSKYRYLLVRKITGQAATPEAAGRQAEKKAQQAIHSAVDVQPCPTCGLVQPDMIGQQRAKLHLAIWWVALLLFITLVIFRASNLFREDQLTRIAGIVGLVAVLAHLLIEWRNPNGNLDRNQATAASRVAAGELIATPARQGLRNDNPFAPARQLARTLALPLSVLAVGLIAMPEVVRTMSAWPLNDECYPPVVGPGDSTTVYMHRSISPIKGYWRGKPEAELEIPAHAPLRLGATAKDNNWGDTIYAKSSEKSSKVTPWVEVTLPNTPDLARSSGMVHAHLTVDYPQSMGSTFEVQTEVMDTSVPVKLAPAGAGASYDHLWWEGFIGGFVIILALGQCLRLAARALQKSAPATQVYPAASVEPIPAT